MENKYIYSKLDKAIQDYHDKRGFMPNLIIIDTNLFNDIVMSNSKITNKATGKHKYKGIDLAGNDYLGLNSCVIFHTSDLDMYGSVQMGWTSESLNDDSYKLRCEMRIKNKPFFTEINGK